VYDTFCVATGQTYVRGKRTFCRTRVRANVRSLPVRTNVRLQANVPRLTSTFGTLSGEIRVSRAESIASGLRRDESRAAGAGTESPPLAPEGRTIPETRTRRAKTAPDAAPKTSTRRAKATTAPKTDAPKTAKTTRAAKSPELRAAESDARRAALAAKKDPENVALARKAKRAKANVAKIRDGAPTETSAPTPTRGKTGPTPARIALAKTVAGLRAKGEKWSDIATATGASEPTLAKLRKDVRAGVFANLSPATDRTPAGGPSVPGSF
jgi:hypothetical protein